MKQQLRNAPCRRLSLQPMVITGHVVDRYRKPLKGVQILFQGRNIGETGRNGYYAVKVFDPIAHIALTWELKDFVPMTELILKTNTHKTKVEVVLQAITMAVPFDVHEGVHGLVGGAYIHVPPCALLEVDGKAYCGKAGLTFSMRGHENQALPRWSFPTSTETSRAHLRMMHLHIRNADGQPLQLASDAKIGFSLDACEWADDNGATPMGLYRIDRERGRWQLLQCLDFHVATQQYRGTITGLDGPMFLGPIEIGSPMVVCVRDLQTQSPIPDMQVVAYGGDCDVHGMTDAEGRLRMQVPFNAFLVLEAQGEQGTVCYRTPHPTAVRTPERVTVIAKGISTPETITIWVHGFPIRPPHYWPLPKHAALMQ